ncbi:MAG: hypothetical protein AAFQ80_15425 [Cyanobacteria bacterium J06621_8]
MHSKNQRNLMTIIIHVRLKLSKIIMVMLAMQQEILQVIIAIKAKL